LKEALKPIAVVLTVHLVIFLISWAGFAISVAMSGPKGQGDAIKQKNSAENWTAQQAKFESSLRGHPSRRRENRTGQRTARSHPQRPDTSADRRRAKRMHLVRQRIQLQVPRVPRRRLQELLTSPHEIDRTDPAFDCK
jgi:hypothetical protein